MTNTKTIYLLMSYTGTRFAKLLRRFSNEPYPHVSISFNTELTDMYSFGRRKVYNPLAGGFVHESIDKGVYDKFKNIAYAVYSLEVTDEQYTTLKKSIEEFAKEQDRYHYNLLGIITYNLNINYERKYYYFCTQFVDTVFKRSGIFLNDKPSAFVTPADFRTCDKLTYLYSAIKE